MKTKVIYTCLFWRNGTEREEIGTTFLNEREIFVPFGSGYHRSFSRKLHSLVTPSCRLKA
uniref:Ycf15 n=1 Tax=Romanomermis culicivorax TaxID=13658 RepID=A0A915ICA2_ROMCU